MYFEHIDHSHKYLEDILSIIRYGISQKRLSLRKKKREGINTQLLVDAFNLIGTQNIISDTWIGAQKEHEQENSKGKEDIYFYLGDDNYTRIFYVEAKRLPKYKSKNDEEYVIGESSTHKPSGGIQRYKLLSHGGSSLRHNGMIAYIENKSVDDWLLVVNEKIGKEYPTDSKLSCSTNPNEFISTHSYNDIDGSFVMHHFWIDISLN